MFFWLSVLTGYWKNFSVGLVDIAIFLNGVFGIIMVAQLLSFKTMSALNNKLFYHEESVL